MTPRTRRRGRAAFALLPALALLAGACAHAPRASRRGAGDTIEPDSVTVGLWRFDEVGGIRAADSGPNHLDGTAGTDTRTDFGRDRNARFFSLSVNSFVLVPYAPIMDAPGAMTIEAWVDPGDYGQNEDTPIVTRWTPLPNQQSWMLSVLGRRTYLDPGTPGYHRDLPLLGQAGLLMFAFQTEEAGPPRVYFSTQPILRNRWTHVAVTYDGRVVRMYLDGFLDAQFASPGRIRASDAPVLIGNFLDPRQLSSFSGELSAGPAMDPRPAYAFQGGIDEVRMSSAVRTHFPGVNGR
jgi:concanavalin A-like lectin/glucanase superfamily protein